MQTSATTPKKSPRKNTGVLAAHYCYSPSDFPPVVSHNLNPKRKTPAIASTSNSNSVPINPASVTINHVHPPARPAASSLPFTTCSAGIN
eukprot:g60673.t1